LKIKDSEAQTNNKLPKYKHKPITNYPNIANKLQKPLP